MYQAIFFDAGSTLIDARLNREERFWHFAQEWALGLEPEAAHAAHQQTYQLHFGQGFPVVNSLAEDEAIWLAFYRDLLAAGRVPDPQDALARRFAAACHWQHWMYAYPGVPETLAHLRGRFKIGLLSNAPPSLRQVRHSLNLDGYFDHMVISGEVGVRKPAAGIYQIALASLGVGAGESLFVDDLEENLVAAREIGMDVLLIDYKNAHPETAFPRITNIGDVMGFMPCV